MSELIDRLCNVERGQVYARVSLADLDAAITTLSQQGPKLPPGWTVVGNSNDITIGRDGRYVHLAMREDGPVFDLLSAFLPTPDKPVETLVEWWTRRAVNGNPPDIRNLCAELDRRFKERS